MNLGNHNQFDLLNARICAAASACAYTGVLTGRYFAGASGRMVSAPQTDTQVLIAEFTDCAIIAFRGSSSIRDFITDAEFTRTQFSYRTGEDMAEIHTGFLRAFDSIIPPMSDVIKQLVLSDRPIFVTGHSLGGALAVLCALELNRRKFNVAQVITFGQPRVGNKAFAALYSAALGDRTFRVVHEEDIVARVPHLPQFTDPYRHAGTEVLLSSFGEVIVGPSLWQLLKSDVAGLVRAFAVSKLAGFYEAFSDHKIANYVNGLETA